MPPSWASISDGISNMNPKKNFYNKKINIKAFISCYQHGFYNLHSSAPSFGRVVPFIHQRSCEYLDLASSKCSSGQYNWRMYIWPVYENRETDRGGLLYLTMRARGKKRQREESNPHHVSHLLSLSCAILSFECLVVDYHRTFLPPLYICRYWCVMVDMLSGLVTQRLPHHRAWICAYAPVTHPVEFIYVDRNGTQASCTGRHTTRIHCINANVTRVWWERGQWRLVDCRWRLLLQPRPRLKSNEAPEQQRRTALHGSP